MIASARPWRIETDEHPSVVCESHHRSAALRHAPAFIGTLETCLRTGLTMSMVVLGALLGAGFAYVGTEATYRRDLLAAACHERRGQPTNVGAIHAERNTSDHGRHIAVLQTVGCAIVASAGARIARLDAGSEFSVHDDPPR